MLENDLIRIEGFVHAGKDSEVGQNRQFEYVAWRTTGVGACCG